MRALRHDGRPRRYLVHRPAGRDDGAPLPVVVVLHGTGATAAWTLGDTGWADKADREGFLVVLPDGLRPDLAKPPHFVDNPQVWNDGSPKLVPNEPEGDDVGFIDADARRRWPRTSPWTRGGSTSPAFPTAPAWPSGWRRSGRGVTPPWRRWPATAG